LAIIVCAGGTTGDIRGGEPSAAGAADAPSRDAAPVARSAGDESSPGGPKQAGRADPSPAPRPKPASEAAIPAKVYRYAKRLVAQYDRNGDGKLQETEWRRMHGQPARADANRDGVITVEELAQWIAAFGAQHKPRLAYPVIGATEPAPVRRDSDGEKSAGPEPGAGPPSSQETKSPEGAGPAAGQADSNAPPRPTRFHVGGRRLPPGLPAWFLERDADGDGQLTLSEFAPHATAADREEFARYDLNGDGVITPQECLKALRAQKASKRAKDEK
jgi:hypothetical protein